VVSVVIRHEKKDPISCGRADPVNGTLTNPNLLYQWSEVKFGEWRKRSARCALLETVWCRECKVCSSFKFVDEPRKYTEAVLEKFHWMRDERLSLINYEVQKGWHSGGLGA